MEEQRQDVDRKARNLRLRQLQVAAARERLARGIERADDRLALARLLRDLMLASAGGVTREEVLDAARAAHSADPSDSEPLELLVSLLTEADSLDERESVLRKLEAIAPHSAALEGARQTSRPGNELPLEARALIDGARRLAEELDAKHDGDHPNHVDLTYYFWQMGEHDRALHHYTRAMETAPTVQDRAAVIEMLNAIGADQLLDMGLPGHG